MEEARRDLNPNQNHLPKLLLHKNYQHSRSPRNNSECTLNYVNCLIIMKIGNEIQYDFIGSFDTILPISLSDAPAEPRLAGCSWLLSGFQPIK